LAPEHPVALISLQGVPALFIFAGFFADIAFSEWLWTESPMLKDFFSRKSPSFMALKKSMDIPKMLWPLWAVQFIGLWYAPSFGCIG
jgi:hypothetical protein